MPNSLRRMASTIWQHLCVSVNCAGPATARPDPAAVPLLRCSGSSGVALLPDLAAELAVGSSPCCCCCCWLPGASRRCSKDSTVPVALEPAAASSVSMSVGPVMAAAAAVASPAAACCKADSSVYIECRIKSPVSSSLYSKTLTAWPHKLTEHHLRLFLRHLTCPRR